MQHTINQIAALPAAAGCTPVLRRGDVSNNKEEPDAPAAITDNGNYIVDLKFNSAVADVPGLATQVVHLLAFSPEQRVCSWRLGVLPRGRHARAN